jgi:hypothetical protein
MNKRLQMTDKKLLVCLILTVTSIPGSVSSTHAQTPERNALNQQMIASAISAGLDSITRDPQSRKWTYRARCTCCGKERTAGYACREIRTLLRILPCARTSLHRNGIMHSATIFQSLRIQSRESRICLPGPSNAAIAIRTTRLAHLSK